MPLGDTFPPLPAPRPAPAPPGGGCPPGFTGTPPNCVMSGVGPQDTTPAPAALAVPTPTPVPITANGGTGSAGPGFDRNPNPEDGGSGGTTGGGGGTSGATDPRCPGVSARACRSFHEINSNISLAQWQAWDQFADPTCPPTHPYRSQKMLNGAKANTCEESPDNCPPGTAAFGPNECRPSAGGGAGGAGGGGGGRGTPAPRGSDSFAALLESFLRRDLNAPSRYTPEALQGLYGQTTRQASGQIARGSAAVRADAARRGMSRAGMVGAGLRDVRAQAEGQRGAANVGIMQSKINADFQDKSAALDRAQRYLDSLRDSEYRYTLMSEQRRQFDANLALAYANLQSQWDMLQARFGHELVLGGGV